MLAELHWEQHCQSPKVKYSKAEKLASSANACGRRSRKMGSIYISFDYRLDQFAWLRQPNPNRLRSFDYGRSYVSYQASDPLLQ